MKKHLRSNKPTEIFPKDRTGSNVSQGLGMIELPQIGLLRINMVLRFVPVSRSSWWSGVKSGRYPQPIKLSKRVTVWKAQDIKAICDGEGRNE